MTDEKSPADSASMERREALEDLGYATVPEVVEALEVAVDRGHHVGLLAGEGSGREVLYGLAARARCDVETQGVQALALCPTRETAARVARAVQLLNGCPGWETKVWAPEGDAPEPPTALFVAGRPEQLLREVRVGRLSLSEVRLLIVDGVEALRNTGGWPAAEIFLDTLESGGQKIVCGETPGPEFEELVAKRLPRARVWPPELLGRSARNREEETVGKERGGTRAPKAPTLWYAAAAGEEAKLSALTAGLRRLYGQTGADVASVRCPDAPTAHRTAAHLAAMGFRMADESSERGVTVAWVQEEQEDEVPGEGIHALLWLPDRLVDLVRWLGAARGRLVVADPLKVPQLKLMARRADWEERELSQTVTESDRDTITRFRAELRALLERGDYEGEVLLLEPLLEEFGASQVAAALARLARSTPVEPSGAEPVEKTALQPAWTSLYINVGKRDSASPGDLVGAITGETSAQGAQVGKIEIRHSFSLVNVDSQIADDVIRGLKGTRIRGRDVVARRER